MKLISFCRSQKIRRELPFKQSNGSLTITEYSSGYKHFGPVIENRFMVQLRVPQRLLVPGLFFILLQNSFMNSDLVTSRLLACIMYLQTIVQYFNSDCQPVFRSTKKYRHWTLSSNLEVLPRVWTRDTLKVSLFPWWGALEMKNK